MKQLAAEADSRPIDLFHSTSVLEPAAIDKLMADARAAGVRLQLIVSGKDGRLDGNTIRQAVPAWSDASIWFCGPAGFAKSLRRDFLACGMAPQHFHQELFEMR